VETILYLIIAAPLGANAFYSRRLELASIIAASLALSGSLGVYLSLPVSGFFGVTRLSWYFLVAVSSVYLTSTVYSGRYISSSHTKFPRNLYFLLLNFFAVSMFFTLFVNNLGLIWVGVEATTVSTILLIFMEGSEASAEAAWRYVVIVSAGIAFAFISVVLVYYSLHTLSLNKPGGQSLVLALAVGIALAGFGTKVGVFPLNTWLPDAHSEAPAPVSAMFSGVLLPVVLYALYRVYLLDPLQGVFSAAAIISMLIASLMMASQTNFKRLLAYSTIENINLALLGLVIGQPLGAAILILGHAFGKSSAFYSSGLLQKITGSKKIDAYGIHRLSYLPYSLTLSSLCITGAPPFATFVGEFLILFSLLRFSLAGFALVLFSLGLSFVSMSYHISRMLFSGDGPLAKEDRLMGGLSLLTSLVPLMLGVLLIWWLL
jgi:hydrogenase-4 component F